MYENVTMRGVRVTIVDVEEQCYTILSCVFVALVIHNSIRMRHILFSSVPCLTLIT